LKSKWLGTSRVALARTLRHFRYRRLIRHFLAERPAPLPVQVVFVVTNRCNLTCTMCYYSRNYTNQRNPEMSFEEICQVIDRIPKSVKHFEIIGGEPLMRRDLPDILHYLSLRGIRCTITTNGTLFTPKIINRVLTMNHLDHIQFSIDGPLKIHDLIRGRGTFNKAAGALRVLATRLPVHVITVLMPQNINHLLQVPDLLLEWGVKYWTVSPVRLYRSADVARSASIMGLGEDCFLVRHEPQPRLEFTLDRLERVLSEIEASCRKAGITLTYLPPDLHRSPAACCNPEQESFCKPGFCTRLLKVRLDWAGNLTHCYVFHPVLGNLLVEDFQQAWNGPTYRSFRRKFLEVNLLPVCRICPMVEYFDER
jgi:MoaA/NifB/PqqE/SkfB family radical SAM enzyme